MKIEERLHDAMHEYADTIEPDPGSWTRISARFDETLTPVPSPRSRRPLVLAGVALALVAVLITTLVVRDDGEEGRVVTDPLPTAAMPSRILAVSPANGQPEILDSVTGTSEQQFALGGIAAGTQVAVGPSGRDSFVVLGDGNEGCADHRIQPWPLVASTDFADPIEDATSPTVSLDGRYLAYLHCLPGDARADEIVLQDLATGATRTTPAPSGTFFMNRLEFAADSRHVVYQLFDDAPGSDTVFELDLVGGGAAPGRAVGGAGWAGIRGLTGQYLTVNGVDSTVGSMQPSPPYSTAPLFTLPNPPTQVVADRSGRHLLALAGRDLYRWSVGDDEPTKLPGEYIAAAWIPDAPATPPAPVSTAMPTRVVVGQDGRLGVLSAVDGQEVNRSLGDFTGLSSVSASFDASTGGHRVFFTSTGTSGACGSQPGSDVSSMHLISDPVQSDPQLRVLENRRFVGGAQTPVVSPDGRVVAYGIACDGPALGLTQLRPSENVRVEPFVDERAQSGNVDTVEVLSWAPDSQLIYRVWFDGDASPRYYVGQFRGAVPKSAMDVYDIQAAPDVVAATFIDDDNLAIATNTNRDGVSIVKGLPLESVVDASNPGSVLITPTLFEVPGLVTSLVADPSGNHFLARNDDGALYRWSAGDGAPTKLADGVTAAAWIPDAPATPSAPEFIDGIPLGFPASVPLPTGLTLRSTASTSDPPNTSFDLIFGLGDQDAKRVADQYRDTLDRAGFAIDASTSLPGNSGSITKFDAIGEEWDVRVSSGIASTRDPRSFLVQVLPHGYQPAPGLVPTTTPGP